MSYVFLLIMSTMQSCCIKYWSTIGWYNFDEPQTAYMVNWFSIRNVSEKWDFLWARKFRILSSGEQLLKVFAHLLPHISQRRYYYYYQSIDVRNRPRVKIITKCAVHSKWAVWMCQFRVKSFVPLVLSWTNAKMMDHHTMNNNGWITERHNVILLVKLIKLVDAEN